MQLEVVTVWDVPETNVNAFVETEVILYVPSTPFPDVASNIIESPTDKPCALLLTVTVVVDCV